MFDNIDQGKEISSLPKVHYIQDCFCCHSCKGWEKSTHAVLTEAFLQMIRYCFYRSHETPNHPLSHPFCSTRTYLPRHCWKWHREMERFMLP